MTGQDLQDYKWKNRLLIFVAENTDNKILKTNLTAFTEQQKELTERDLMIFVINPTHIYNQDGSKANLNPGAVYEQLNLSSGFKGLLLIGKDGFIKAKKAYPVAPEAIFAKIDGMPMRQAEQRDKER